MSSGLFPNKLPPKPLQASLPELDHNWRTKSETTGHCSSQFLDNTASFKHMSLAPQKTPCQRTELDLQMVKVTGVERRCPECCEQGARNRCLEHKEASAAWQRARHSAVAVPSNRAKRSKILCLQADVFWRRPCSSASRLVVLHGVVARGT